MIMLDNTTAIVYNTDDLRDAVSTDNGIDYVYFGANITLAYGITIYPNKPSLVFDGTFEGVTYTFTDMNSSSDTNTLGIRSISNITITFQNINLVGRNFYGIPYVPNNASFSGASTIYINVTYSGTQICHNPYGFASFTDCNITVSNNEVAEVSRLEIGGVTTMTKTNQANAIFWFYGSSTLKPYLKILSDAKVTITTAHYFMYISYSPDYIIEPGASFTLNTNSGISWTASHTVASFFVGENASFNYTQATNRGYSTIYLNGALTVSQGASFYMQADFVNTASLIRFTSSSGGLYINNPKSFVMYNRGASSAASAFNFSSGIPITLSGGQINYWTTARLFPIAGTFGDNPTYKWNRPSWNQFTLRGTASNTQTNITFNDFTPDELAPLPPFTNMRLNTAMVFSIGRIPLTIYSTVVTKSVTGVTEPYGNVKIIYVPSYYEDPQTAIADENGLFTLVPSAPVPLSDYIDILANTPFLIVSVEKRIHAESALYIENAPVQIKFPFRPMAGFADIILPRENPFEPVTVVDTREAKTQWQLWAKIAGPLKTEDDDILDDAVVFALQDGSMATLGATFSLVHVDGQYYEEETDVIWEETKGVLARITVPIRSGKKYTTRLSWTVAPIGVIPEEGE